MNSLQRYLDAQKEDFFVALREMKDGAKRTHWMWYIFPVHKGLGRTPTAKKYWLDSQEEAKNYLGHPVLGKRLREITEAVLRTKASVPSWARVWTHGSSRHV